MSIDLNTLSAKELESLITQARKRKTTLSKRKPIGAVRKKLAALAKNEGYTIAELFGAGASAGAAVERAPRKKSAAKKTRKPLGKVAPKYRDPADPTGTWSGRGKQPRWLAAYTATGRDADEFLIR